MKQRILLVIRDSERRQALYHTLSRRGFVLCTSPCGEAALQAMEFERPDLILLAPDLPDMTPGVFLEKIHSFEPDVPILLLDSEQPLPGPSIQVPLPPATSPKALVNAVQFSFAMSPYRPVGRSCPAKILVVDDEPRMRAITQRILELNGFQVAMAGSGEESLRQLSLAPVDAVILDIRMPGMDGLVVLKKIRDTYALLPVILMTQADEDAIREEARRLGAKGYLTKPVNFGQLKELLYSVVPSANTKSPTSSANGSDSNDLPPATPPL